MNESMLKTFISKGDFIDVYHKIKQKGIAVIFTKLKLSSNSRVASKWDSFVSISDFWVIPEIQQRWNCMISGDKNTEYEDYVVNKYLKDKSDLKMLSIGCGEGYHDRKFAKYNCFSTIDAVDISSVSILNAKEQAIEKSLKINYLEGDFKEMAFSVGNYDLILFNSSLHHFDAISSTLEKKVKPLLTEKGIVVVFEYVGPNRLQWSKLQLAKSNELLQQLPNRYKLLYDKTSLKKKAYCPGILRMLVVDPSEAPDSESIVSSLDENFKVLEKTNLGWNILHILLKGIAHNFVNEDKETKELLEFLFIAEDDFIKEDKTSDAIFGVYQNR
jgi:ubiquinone/menaquinone biosynthesis C-methylase UbiE